MRPAFAPAVLGTWLCFAAPATPCTAQADTSFERDLAALPDTASARAMTRDLSARTHMAGTPAQADTRDYVIAKMRSWGLETWTKAYSVYLPQPDTVAAWVMAGRGKPAHALYLNEPPLPGLPPPEGQAPPFNAYTGDGDVTADVVYANYGLIKDYQTLAALGVDVRGKLVVARYGRSFRGIKAREAGRHGAAGLILYSDPQDDGYVRGDVYPDGPMRPAGGIQRGSVLTDNGDPTTPSWSSIPGAHRLPEESLHVAHIPIIPMGYGNARSLLSSLAGPSAPTGWQGGLPFHYHLGPGPTRLRLKVATERGLRAFHTIWNTFGMIRGAMFPDEWVIVGAHRDAWSPGAADNVSGTVTVLETARAFAELARRGRRPARTIIFATWDGEEWGLIGSTEWVEEMEDSVQARVVAYLNEEDLANGPRFEGAASPSLKPFVREITRAVPDPGGKGSVYDAWLREAAGDSDGLELDDFGGGSDFVAFTHHVGVAALATGFGGPTGVYHSAYDSYDWMSRFGDPGFLEHRAAGQLACVAAARIANARVLPFDYVAFGSQLSGLVPRLDSGIAARHWTIQTTKVGESLTRFTAAARSFATVRDSAESDGRTLGATRDAAVNHWLLQVERRLTRPEGLTSRPWYRSLEFASDPDNGYSTMPFPSVTEAIRYADVETAEREIADLATRIDAAREALDRAAAALR